MRYAEYAQLTRQLGVFAPLVADEGFRCFLYTDSDPDKSVNSARKTLELICRYLRERCSRDISNHDLAGQISYLTKEKLINSRVRARMDFVRQLGNIGSHASDDVEENEIDEDDSNRCAEALFFILSWFADSETGGIDGQGLEFPRLMRGLRLLKKRLNAATKEQKDVLVSTRWSKRSAISGCAGSGKTFLAMARAEEYDQAGVKTLFLCHNPFLAEFVSDALAQTNVDVFTLKSFVYHAAQMSWTPEGWSMYDDATLGEIEMAVSKYEDLGIVYDAIVIDEAQDFDDNFWILVEFLSSRGAGYLFFVYDNNQSLLPFRSRYPSVEKTEVLNVNVRNSSEIASVVSKFHVSSVLSRSELKGGTVEVRYYKKGSELTAIALAVSSLYSSGVFADAFIVATDVTAPEDSLLAGLEFQIMPHWDWRIIISNMVSRYINQIVRKAPAESRVNFQSIYEELSADSYPNSNDILLIADWAKNIRMNLPLTRSKTSITSIELKHYSVPEFAGSPYPFDYIDLLSSGEWAEMLPRYGECRIIPVDKPLRGQSIRLHTFATVKGLEADGVITFVPSVVPGMKTNAYVSISRARLHHELVMLEDISGRLPKL